MWSVTSQQQALTSQGVQQQRWKIFLQKCETQGAVESFRVLQILFNPLTLDHYPEIPECSPNPPQNCFGGSVLHGELFKVAEPCWCCCSVTRCLHTARVPFPCISSTFVPAVLMLSEEHPALLFRQACTSAEGFCTWIHIAHSVGFTTLSLQNLKSYL